MDNRVADPVNTDALRKVQKLLELSRSNNDHEAALAAQRAAELMQKHGISEAMLRTTEEAPELIVKDHTVDGEDSRKKEAWKKVIFCAVAKSYGAHPYYWGAKFCCLGRQSAVQATSYTYAYLTAEIERLSGDAWEAKREEYREACDYGGDAVYDRAALAGRARSWKNSFKLGASNSVATRLYEGRKTRKQQVEVQAAAAAADAGLGASAAKTALVRVERDQEEVDIAYQEMSKGFRHTSSRNVISVSSAYNAGKNAGGSIGLGGGKGLGRPSPRLGGR